MHSQVKPLLVISTEYGSGDLEDFTGQMIPTKGCDLKEIPGNWTGFRLYRLLAI